jgi:hypothetical protein
MQLPPGRSKQGTRIVNYNLQDDHLLFEPERNNLSSYGYCQLRLEQAKVAILLRVDSRNGWKTRVLLTSTGWARAMQGVRLIEESMTFATTLFSLT